MEAYDGKDEHAPEQIQTPVLTKPGPCRSARTPGPESSAFGRRAP